MEVVLLENIKSLGNIGDVVNVKRGHGRNFLIKYGKALIASKTGITTVADFRPADIANGGQGAPLVPFLDAIIFKNKNNIALQNIGGIANVSYVSTSQLTAFDNGPGNMLINSMIYLLSAGKFNYDHDGQWAAKGKINTEVSDYCFQHVYFKQGPPKSTGRELFGEHYSKYLLDK